ncbi:pyridoxal phosphate-dependent aminotransferase [Fodinicola feengrottensis]
MAMAGLVTRMQEFGTTIFAEMSALAVRTGAINLGQGFPDTDGPAEVIEAAVEALRTGQNQYPPGPGIAALRQAIARHQRHWYGLDYDPDSEVMVTAGATEAITAAILALCEPGDEVLCLEPYYDSYAACIALAQAVRKPVLLHAPTEPGGRFTFDPAQLRAAITPKTKVLLLNSPHNPTGFVATREELAAIAQICVDHDLVAITDEVYEHLVFTDAAAYKNDPAVESVRSGHIPLATFPGMRERTIQISSVGKTFSFTGWKVGWVCARPELVSAVTKVKQFMTYVNAAPLQPAVAVALNLDASYYPDFAAGMQSRRDLLRTGLADAGLTVLRTEGTYFVTCDVSSLGVTDGLEFCRAMPERCGVVAIPSQVFYDHQDEARHLVRFAFCKRPEVLTEAAKRLAKLKTG